MESDPVGAAVIVQRQTIVIICGPVSATTVGAGTVDSLGGFAMPLGLDIDVHADCLQRLAASSRVDFLV